uniref:SEA domain-containing protein n=1 Tax=Globodera pallida TaxID=36090 RepID=A0A183C8G8_GLOPA
MQVTSDVCQKTDTFLEQLNEVKKRVSKFDLESPSPVTRNFFEMPVTASTSYVMTALKNAVIGVIGVNVNVMTSSLAEYPQ